jgi:hypothetical protein
MALLSNICVKLQNYLCGVLASAPPRKMKHNAEDGLITKASHWVEDDDDLAFLEKFEML